MITTTSSSVAAANTVVESELHHFLYHSPKWVVSEARDLLADGPRNGISPPASESGAGLPTLSISAIRGGFVTPEGSLKYAAVSPDDVEQFQLRRSDILVVRGNGNRQLCGRAGIVREFPEGCFYPDLLIRLRFRTDCLLPEFAVMQWNEPKTHSRLLQKAKSTNGIWKVNGQDIKSHRLAAPPLAEQERFLKHLRTRAATARH